jgi:Transmembrane protein of unknown function (DUF3556)
VLLELIGVAGSRGPLAGKIKPMTGGERRTWFDVGLYIVLMISVAVPLFSPGVHSDSLSAAIPSNTSGLLNPALLIAPIVMLVIMGRRGERALMAVRCGENPCIAVSVTDV